MHVRTTFYWCLEAWNAVINIIAGLPRWLLIEATADKARAIHGQAMHAWWQCPSWPPYISMQKCQSIILHEAG